MHSIFIYLFFFFTFMYLLWDSICFVYEPENQHEIFPLTFLLACLHYHLKGTRVAKLTFILFFFL